MEAAFSKGQYLITEESPDIALAWLRGFQTVHIDKLPANHGHWLYVLYQFINAFTVDYQLDSAKVYVEKCNAIIRNTDFPKKIAARIYNLDAWIATLNREYSRGVKSAKDAYEYAKQAYPDDPAVPNNTLYTISALYYYASKQDSALLYARMNADNNLEIYGPTSAQLGSTWNLFGAIYLQMKDYERALESFKKAETIYRLEYERTGQYGNLVLILGNIGLIYFENKEFELAREYCERASSFEEQLYGPESEALVLNISRLAQIYSALGDHNKAIKFAKRALDIQKRQPESSITSIAQFTNILGVVNNHAGNYSVAIDVLNEAIELYSQSEEDLNTTSISPMLELGQVYLNQQNYVEAEKTFHLAKEAYHKLEADTRLSVSSCFLGLSKANQESDVNQSMEYIDSALWTLTNNYDESFSSGVQDVNWHPGFADLIIQKLSLLESIDEQRDEQIIEIVKSYDGRLENLLGLIRSDSRLIDLQNKNTQIYNYAIEALINKGNFADAFRYSERIRAIILRFAVNRTAGPQFADVPLEIIRKDKELRAAARGELSARFTKQVADNPDFGDQVSSALESYRAFKSQLQIDFPKYYNTRYGLPEIDLISLQSVIPHDHTLLSYRYLGSKLVVFIVEKDNFHCHEYESHVDSLITMNYEWVRDLKDVSGISRTLYKRLWEPIHSRIGHENVVIVGDGLLHYLCFDQLQNDRGEFLIQEKNISYGIASDMIFSLPNRHRSSNYITAFAPGFEDDDTIIDRNMMSLEDELSTLAPLPKTMQLASKLSAQKENKIFLGRDATENHFYKTNLDSDIAVFATHALLDDRQPMQSKLILVPNDDSLSSQDGLLHTHEIYAKEMSASLAILTACNTGVGKISHGEGMLSLAHAFAYAGCPTVVSTKWTVDEKASVQITEKFLQNLSKGMSKSESLREAKISFFNDSPEELQHPFYWSGIILTGDPRKMAHSSNSILNLGLMIIFMGSLLFGLLRYMN